MSRFNMISILLQVSLVFSFMLTAIAASIPRSELGNVVKSLANNGNESLSESDRHRSIQSRDSVVCTVGSAPIAGWGSKLDAWNAIQYLDKTGGECQVTLDWTLIPGTCESGIGVDIYPTSTSLWVRSIGGSDFSIPCGDLGSAASDLLTDCNDTSGYWVLGSAAGYITKTSSSGIQYQVGIAHSCG